MRAVIYETYGPPDVLELKDIPKPVPKADEVLIKVRATTVTSADWRARSLSMPKGFATMGRLVFGVTKPRQPILGTELSGDVESVGTAVSKFKAGDQVIVFTGGRMGCHVEYKCVNEAAQITRKPANLSYEAAAAISFGGMASLAFLRGNIQKGDRVLINGASGGVGTAAVQLAKHFGASVTAVCSRTNVELVTSLGADHVIDYGVEDFTKNGERYDVIVDTVGTAPFSRSRNSLKTGGRLLLILSSFPELLMSPWRSLTSGIRVVAGPKSPRAGDVDFLADLAESGALKAVIDQVYPLAQIRDAHQRVDTGRKRGSVVITVS